MRRYGGMLVLALLLALAIPQCALGFEKEAVDGVAAPEYSLPKESLDSSGDAGVEPGTIGAAGGGGGGTNNISFSKFGTGDYCCAFSDAIGHSGLFDGGLFKGSVYDMCMRTANVRPRNGVQLEAPVQYRRYDRAYGLWIPRASQTKRYSARNFCRSQSGEPYDIRSSKTDYSRWYCSKLIWAAYKSVGFNLDPNGGYWVTPADLYRDGDAALFAKGS